jgi:hypothetical protein
MFRWLLGAVFADMDRQIRWAKFEIRRQTHYTALKAILVGVASLAALGAIVVGLVALYFWLEMQAGLFAALGVIGGGLLLLALILFVLAFAQERPGLASRPQLQIMRPAALLGTLTQGTHGEQAIGVAAGSRRHGSRPVLLGTLAFAIVVGLLAGRRL